MDLSTSVTMRLVSLCLEESGALVTDGFVEATLRAAALVDVVLSRGIDDGVDQYWIDCTPVGLAPIDDFLRLIETEPGRSVGWWIGRGPRLQASLAEQWVTAGAWQRLRRRGWFTRARYAANHEVAAADPAKVRATCAAVRSAGGRGYSASDAAVAALSQTAELDGVLEPRNPLVVHASGPAQWLVRLADDLISQDRLTYLTAQAALQSQQGGGET